MEAPSADWGMRLRQAAHGAASRSYYLGPIFVLMGSAAAVAMEDTAEGEGSCGKWTGSNQVASSEVVVGILW